MWEDLTIALCCLGFMTALALMLIELPAIARQVRDMRPAGWRHDGSGS